MPVDAGIRSSADIIAGVATAQESAIAVVVQRLELHGPAMYYTMGVQTQQSAELLVELLPNALISGHCPPLEGDSMRAALPELARGFTSLVLHEEGRYVDVPVRADILHGVTYVGPE